MKILLDECLPRKFQRAFPEHECQTVPEAGFAGQKNGHLISLAESAGFDVFPTMDKGLQYQQNLTVRPIAIVIIRARSNRLVDILPCLEECRSAMRALRPGSIIRVGS